MTIDELVRVCAEHDIPITLGDLIHERHAAMLLSTTVRNLRRWRADGEGPEAVQIGRSWYYPLSAFVRLVSREGSTARLHPHEHRRRSDRCSLKRRSA